MITTFQPPNLKRNLKMNLAMQQHDYHPTFGRKTVEKLRQTWHQVNHDDNRPSSRHSISIDDPMCLRQSVHFGSGFKQNWQAISRAFEEEVDDDLKKQNSLASHTSANSNRCTARTLESANEQDKVWSYEVEDTLVFVDGTRIVEDAGDDATSGLSNAIVFKQNWQQISA